MVELQHQLLQCIEELDLIIKKAEEFIAHAPEGSLRISRNMNSWQYYWRTDPKDTHGNYIRKKEKQLIEDLAQKDYALKMLHVAEKQRAKIQEFLNQYDPNEFILLYEAMQPQRRKLIRPYILQEEEYVSCWEQQKQDIKSKQENISKEENNSKQENEQQMSEDKIYTEKGEWVRSKSEKILADKFYYLNIPYVYEPSLHLNGYGYIKPDFVVLNRRTRKEYYWEHFGLMDQKEYCEKAIKKIETYERNKIMVGNSLILTYETQNHPLNKKTVDQLFSEYLL